MTAPAELEDLRHRRNNIAVIEQWLEAELAARRAVRCMAGKPVTR